MPIKIQSDLPVKSVLEHENIFVMDENRAMHQDIRPIEIGILNLMPVKEETELHLLRSLANTPIQVDVSFINVSTHESTHTKKSHLNKFYMPFSDIKNRNFDGFIITGAPVEQMEFEEVDYWDEMVEIMDWTKDHVTSTLFLCWGAQAALYHKYGIKKFILPEKMFGVFEHRVMHRKVPLVRGFDDIFYAPHSRHTAIDEEKLDSIEDITVLARSDEAGMFLCMSNDGKSIFVMGHPEYDRMTLDKEYKRDIGRGDKIEVPKNYYPEGNPDERPMLQWRGHGNTLYTNWLNYYVYQSTPYDFVKIDY